MAQANIRAVITAEDRASKTLQNFGRSVENMGERAGRAINRATKVLAVATAGAVTFAVKSAASYEQSRIAFDTFLGSAEKGKKLLKEVSDFARKTPFELPQVVEATQQLLAYGVEAKNVIPNLTMLGNASRGNAEILGRLIMAFGQVKAATRLTGMELRQFTEAGIPLLEELAKSMHKTVPEIKDLVSEGKVGFPEVEKALAGMSGEGGRFFNLMERQSHTFNGVVSNIKDNIGRLARSVVGISETGDIAEGSIFARLKVAAEDLLKTLDANSAAITAKLQQIVDRFIKFVEKVSAAIQGGNFKALVQQWLDKLIEAFVQALPKAIEGLIVLVVQYADDIIFAFVKGLFRAAKEHPLDFLGLLLTLGFMPGKILLALTKALGGIPIIGPIAGWIIRAMGGVARFILAPVRNVFTALGTTIKNAIINGLTGLGGAVLSAIKSSLRSALGGIGGVALKAIKAIIPGLQAGGQVGAGRPYIVGEAGPELFVPRTSGDVVPNNKLGGGNTFNISFQGVFTGSEMEFRKLAIKVFQAAGDVAGMQNNDITAMTTQQWRRV